MCIDCAGSHRSLLGGDRIVHVKSLSLDKWLPTHVDALERAGGNATLNAVLEERMGEADRLGSGGESRGRRDAFVRRKYVEQGWAGEINYY